MLFRVLFQTGAGSTTHQVLPDKMGFTCLNPMTGACLAQAGTPVPALDAFLRIISMEKRCATNLNA